jgi:hypothetical protein
MMIVSFKKCFKSSFTPSISRTKIHIHISQPDSTEPLEQAAREIFERFSFSSLQRALEKWEAESRERGVE